jgi:hypothetical protein
MALVTLEDIKKLLDENKINLKDLEKLSELEKIKEKNAKITSLLDKFEKLVNSKKISTTEVDKMLNNITKILNDNLPKRKAKKSASAPEKVEITDEKVENVENLNENENNQNV